MSKPAKSDSSIFSKRSIMMLLVYLFVIYAAVAAGLFLLQKQLIYFPVPSNFSSDLEMAPGMENRIFSVNGESIQVFVVNPGQSRAMIYFGGNAESVINNAPAFYNHLSGITVYLVNYRGYSESSGTPSEQGFYADADAIFEILNQQHQQISIMGRSLGSGVATYLASRQQIEKLILITPYDSVLNLAKKRFPIFPVAWLLREKYESIDRVNQIKAPTLVILAEHDYIVHHGSSNNLIAEFNPDQIQVKMIPQSDHNTISSHREYLLIIQDFLF